MGRFGNLFKNVASNVSPITSSAVVDSGDDSNFNFDVIGESFQRDHLIALLKRHGALQDGRFPTLATLELEPTNDFDPTAVIVMVEGTKVGYVPKVLSGDVTKLLKDKGVIELQVPGLLGWDINNPQPLIGVRLDLSEFGF